MKTLYKKNLGIFCIIIGIMLLAIITLNYFGDGSNSFFRSNAVEKEIAHQLIHNNPVLVCKNYNDRKVKRELLLNLTRPPDILVLGSSRTMPITNHLFHTDKFFNGSVTSADLEDDIALYYLFHIRGWTPKTVLISMDPWLLNKSTSQRQWYSTFMSEYIHGRNLFLTDNNKSRYLQLNGLLEKYSQLISFYNLKESIKNIHKRTDIVEGDYCHLHLPDGTRLTSAIEDSTSPSQADFTGAIEMSRLSANSVAPNQDKIVLFESFIAYLVKEHINVILYFPPYEPAAYDEIAGSPRYQGFKIVEAYFRSIGKKYGLSMIGGYNPHVSDLSANDFVDDLHLKKSSFGKIFTRV